ncbi:MAG: glycosyltransferase [Desulfovibrionaceae bacterium]|nr:glycosyltransferase [Desulfovibrionaceae bacterium]
MVAAGLRVLVVLPMYGGSLPIGRYCARALAGLGALVEVFEAPDFYPAFGALDGLRVTPERLDHLEQSFLQVVSQAVLAKTETFEPDLVLALAQAPLTRQALKRLRRDGVPTVMWFVEDYRVFPYWEAYAPLYDIFAVIQREPLTAKLAAIGAASSLYLPLAADPQLHKPLALTPVERRKFGSDLSFMGAGYPNRRQAFRELMQFHFKIWGNDWQGETALAALLQDPTRRVTPEEAVKIFCASKINLNLHSSTEPGTLVPRGDFVNPRTFELAMCGAFQLVDRRALLPELFAPDELAAFSDMGELRDKIASFLANEDERAAFAGKARIRALREHTYAARMQTLPDYAAAVLPGWPRPRRSEPALDSLPETLRGEVAGLLDRLGLPQNAAFEDLTWALRREQGKLTSLETSLLFLDEWRKQYVKKG